MVIVVPVMIVVGRMVADWALSPPEPDPAAQQQRQPAVTVPDIGIAAPVSPTPTAPARKVTVVTPDKLGGRSKNTEAGLTKMSSDDAIRLNGIPKVTATVGQFYGSNGRKDLLLVLAAAAPGIAASNLDVLITNATTGAEVVKPPTTVDAGPLGGTAKCAEAKVQGNLVSICGWLDEGSIGLIGFYYVGLDKASAEFPARRAEVEKVS